MSALWARAKRIESVGITHDWRVSSARETFFTSVSVRQLPSSVHRLMSSVLERMSNAFVALVSVYVTQLTSPLDC